MTRKRKCQFEVKSTRSKTRKCKVMLENAKLDELPNEQITADIMSFLERRDICQIRLVNSMLKEAIDKNSIYWKRIYQQHWLCEDNEDESDEDWYEKYKETSFEEKNMFSTFFRTLSMSSGQDQAIWVSYPARRELTSQELDRKIGFNGSKISFTLHRGNGYPNAFITPHKREGFFTVRELAQCMCKYESNTPEIDISCGHNYYDAAGRAVLFRSIGSNSSMSV